MIWIEDVAIEFAEGVIEDKVVDVGEGAKCGRLCDPVRGGEMQTCTFIYKKGTTAKISRTLQEGDRTVKTTAALKSNAEHIK